jgi:serine/threonine protein kinase
MLVMEYANEGNLRKCLMEITNDWSQKLFLLYKIIDGLNSIHEKNLIHYDFHDGNILCSKYNSIYGVFISDYLGSYQLAKSFLEKDSIYGVLPFMAPEVLKGKSYTQASNIYSFSIIMWEFTSRIPPFNDKAHDFQLALSICKGERPEIIENTPQCYVDLMKKCWNEDPSKRPSASEILNIIKEWIFLPNNMKISEELKLNIINIMEFINAPIEHNNLITKPHPQAYYISHLLDFTSKELNEYLEEFLKLEFLEMKQKKDDVEQKLHKLEMIAETYYESSQIELRIKQKELNEMHLAYQKIKLELVNLEQDNYNLRYNLAAQIKEFAEKENNLQDQIISLQNEKLALANNLTEQLKQNKLTNQQTQIQINQLKQIQTEVNIQGLKSQQESLTEQKKQLENKLSQSQVNYQLIEEKKIFNNIKDYLQVQEFTNRNKQINKINNQVNEFLEAKSQFLTLKEKTIEKLQKQYEVISNGIATGIIKEVVSIGDKISEMKKYQDILKEYNENVLSQMGKNYESLINVIQENKELEISLKINNILKLNSFNINKYKIITIATNFQEGTRTQLDSDMMAKDIESLKKKLKEFRLEFGKQKKKLKNLVVN